MCIYRKIQGSSIIEVSVALVLLSIGFLLFLTIYVNITASSLSIKELEARLKLNTFANQIIQNRDFTSGTTDISGLVIESSISYYEGDKNLILLELKAYDGNQIKLADIKKVVYYVEE